MDLYAGEHLDFTFREPDISGAIKLIKAGANLVELKDFLGRDPVEVLVLADTLMHMRKVPQKNNLLGPPGGVCDVD